MDLEEVMAQKKKNLEMLSRNKDEAIRKEMLQYEEAELYIRLQSECFNLYPVVIKAMALLIADDRRRAIFCSIVKGHRLEKLAAAHNMTPEEAVREFRSVVCDLNSRIKHGAFTAKESVNLQLMLERNSLKERLRSYDLLLQQVQQENKELREQLDTLQNEVRAESEAVMTLEKEWAIREEIKKELQEKMWMELKRLMEESKAITTMKSTDRVSFFVRSLRWLKRKLRLGLARTQPPVN